MTTQTQTQAGQKFRLKVDAAAYIPAERVLDSYVGMRASETTSYWCLVFPPASDDDANWGWYPTDYLSVSELAYLGIGTDWRGWHVHESNVEVLGPYVEDPVEADDPVALKAQISLLLSDKAALGEQVRALTDLTNHANAQYNDLVERITTEGERQAANHGWCGVYDEIMESIGLPGRVRDFRVRVRVTYETAVTVQARSADAAREIADDFENVRYWRPGSPIEGYDTSGYDDLEFEVLELGDDV